MIYDNEIFVHGKDSFAVLKSQNLASYRSENKFVGPK